jgi:glutamate-1-semialdehyde 2,1-aminomutase
MFAPRQWPASCREARGCEVVDLDGRRYWDVSIHAIGACLLGYRDPDVTRAVQRQLTLGSFSTLNSPDEVELAELLCTLHPWAEQARFGRSGGEMMAVAVRIARATTDRSRVAVCGYHGWHDWYLAANLGDNDALSGHLLPGLDPRGVPRELRGTTLPFRMNDRAALQQIIENHGRQLAAVVMEPCRYVDPDPGFLEFVREAARRVGALLIFDEITIGWRLLCGGAHLKWGVIPDMAVFAKALGNGHPMAAVIGTRAAMEGGHSSFISSTYWTEGIGPAAALATIHKMQQVDLPSHCARVGRQIQEAWQALGRKHGLPVDVPAGYPALAHFAFQHELSAELKTLYVQEMLRRGFLATTAMYVTLAHTEEIVERYAEVIDEVFEEIAEALGKNEVAARLHGPVAHSTFSRLL